MVDHHVGDRLGEIPGEEILGLAEIERETFEDFHAQPKGLPVIGLDGLLEAGDIGIAVGRVEGCASEHFGIVLAHWEAEIKAVPGVELAVAVHRIPDVAIAAVVFVGLDLEPLVLGQREKFVDHGDGFIADLDGNVVVHRIKEADIVARGANLGGDLLLSLRLMRIEGADVDHRNAACRHLLLS